MNRRKCLLSMLGMGALLRTDLRARTKAVQLHLDLEVDPGREAELIESYHATFEPAIRKQPGFVDVKLLRLREALSGVPPGDAGYRLLISFETEPQRERWVATEEHQRAWPRIEETLTKYTAVSYDVV